jgi:catalase
MKAVKLLTLLTVAAAATSQAQTVPSQPASSLVRRAATATRSFFANLRGIQDDSLRPASQLQFTTENGAPSSSYSAVYRAGKDGPLTFANFHLFDSLARQNRERIPERTVHSRGWGAHGSFEATTDFASKYSMAAVFKKGTRTSTTCRFSTVGGRAGSPDVARDPRGFACKFRTKQGILDFVFNNTPIFFINNPAKFPLFIHTQKTLPQNNLRSKDMVFDYLWQNPEAAHQFLRLFSPLGTPASARFMNGWSGHTYRLVQKDGSWVYVKVFLESNQGVKNFTAAESTQIGGENQEHATEDLFEAIERKEYPSWTVKMAIKTEEQARKYRYSVFDLTKDWFDAKWLEVGKLTLDQNPVNYHEEIEQAHFAPSNMVPGWKETEDPVLQSRIFSYNDAARHRIGANYLSIPVNCPYHTATFSRDGHVSVDGNAGKQPNYPSSAGTYKLADRVGIAEPKLQPNGHHVLWEHNITDLDYEQPVSICTNRRVIRMSTTDGGKSFSALLLAISSRRQGSKRDSRQLCWCFEAG